MCKILQNGDELLWCCLNSFAHTYWMKMLKTLLNAHFKELSSDVLLQNIVEWKLVQAVLEMCAFRSQPAVSYGASGPT